MPSEIRLDRLSALLESLLPRVWLVPAAPATDHPPNGAAEMHLHVGQGSDAEPGLGPRPGAGPVQRLGLGHGQAPELGSGEDQAQTQDLSLHILTDSAPPAQGASAPLGGWPGLSLLVCPGAALAPLHALQRTGLNRWVGFGVAFDGPTGPLLMQEFRQPLHIRLSEANPSLAHIVQLMVTELQSSRCGQPLLMNRAGDIVLIGLLRHLVAQPGQRVGLFRGLSDPRVAKALVAIHTHPAADWTLETLAAEAGMSRTAFAVQFKAVVDTPPGKYLENLRLAMAQRLVHQGTSLKRAAHQTGYASSATLSRALGRLGRTDATEQPPPAPAFSR